MDVEEYIITIILGIISAAVFSIIIFISKSGMKTGMRPLNQLSGFLSTSIYRESSLKRSFCSEKFCHNCLNVAIGCLLLILLDQFRESDEKKCFNRRLPGWGWGDSVPFGLGYPLEMYNDPCLQKSPSFTSLALDIVASIWPNEAEKGLNSQAKFITMGLQYLLNREEEDGRVDWISQSGVTFAHEITGTIRHTAITSVILAKYSKYDSSLHERSSAAINSVFASSAESVGSFWFRQVSQGVIQGDLDALERPKTV